MTPDTLSHRTIASLEPFRHELYALALAISGRAAAAEAALQSGVQQAFGRALEGEPVDVPAEVRQSLLAVNEAPSEEPPAVMPADCWARITAAIQIQAARAQATGVRALNPESVLLNPDPLLAPRKAGLADDGLDPFDMSSTSRIITAAIIALVVGITITIILTTRHIRTPPPSAAHPATTPRSP